MDRGIFILTVMKNILDKLLYKDYYHVDFNMSDYNIGSRKKRNIKDQLLKIHGVINSVLQGKEDPVSFHSDIRPGKSLMLCGWKIASTTYLITTLQKNIMMSSRVSTKLKRQTMLLSRLVLK